MTPSRFDIYVRRDGRWGLRGSMPGENKDAALAKGAEIDAGGEFDGVRIMTVVDYGPDRSPLETLAWISPHLSKVASVTRQMKNQAAAAKRNIADDTGATRDEESRFVPVEPKEDRRSVARRAENSQALSPFAASKKQLPARTVSNLAGRITSQSLIAVAAGVASFLPISFLAKSVAPWLGADPSSAAKFALVASVIIFVAVAATLLSRVYREYSVVFRERENSDRRTNRVPDSNRELARAVPRKNSADVKKNEDARQPLAQVSGQNDAEAPSEPADPPKQGGGLTQQMRRAMLEFLAKSLSAIADEVPTVNRYVSFGLNLFVSGAAERYAKHVELNPMQGFVLVREMVEALGNSPDRVDEYCRQYMDYKAQERYAMMISAGETVMERYVENETEPFRDFPDIIQMWTSDAAARTQLQGIVCIMFTDLVGSTQMTHERGDYGAQEVVRIHNAIVRSALAAHRGREVKHTGDGIMASFTSAADATRAGLEIQKDLAAQNALAGALQVNVRIGLNAGEAVEEEDDFFGTTVQVAARVCDKADTGDVFVTDNVRELASAHRVTFEDAGQYEMKGVPQPMTLYRAVSSDTVGQ